RSSRETYGDNAVGYVRLIRNNNQCIIKADICPEHKVRQKLYSVTIIVNEEDESVQSIECHECAASSGLQLTKCGLMLTPEHPTLGASPDAISQEYIVEVKCPNSEKGFEKFLPKGSINSKCKAQMNLQISVDDLARISGYPGIRISG
ncbi:hypothetical protein ALC62_02644, partial [Cyphomyrmex costatus]